MVFKECAFSNIWMKRWPAHSLLSHILLVQQYILKCRILTMFYYFIIFDLLNELLFIFKLLAPRIFSLSLAKSFIILFVACLLLRFFLIWITSWEIFTLKPFQFRFFYFYRKSLYRPVLGIRRNTFHSRSQAA